MFYLALTFGLEKDPLGAVERAAGLVERLGQEHGVDKCLWMTLAFSDGKNLYAVRYASDGDAPSMHISRDLEDLHRLDPALHGRLSKETRVVVSQPVGNHAAAWAEIPQHTAVTIHRGEVKRVPFKPAPPK
jgi:glutamine amidotransferase